MRGCEIERTGCAEETTWFRYLNLGHPAQLVQATLFQNQNSACILVRDLDTASLSFLILSPDGTAHRSRLHVLIPSC